MKQACSPNAKQCFLKKLTHFAHLQVHHNYTQTHSLQLLDLQRMRVIKLGYECFRFGKEFGTQLGTLISSQRQTLTQGECRVLEGALQ